MAVRPEPPAFLLQARGLRMSYGPLEVLKGVDLTVAAGETLAILGPNGAGKTTLFRVLSGEAAASDGSIVYAGRDVFRMPAFRRVRLGIGRTFQMARVFADMTVCENMLVAIERRYVSQRQSLPGWWRTGPSAAMQQEAIDNLHDVGLALQSDRFAKVLSHGDKKRLELGLALALKPRLLMLDEPTAGMAPADRLATVALLRDLKRRHDMTLLLTEHDMDVVFGLATSVIVLNYGTIIAAGTPDEVRQNARVRDVYLGQGHGHA
jgi:branched-chain amino acid transport system ATP-binding protein